MRHCMTADMQSPEALRIGDPVLSHLPPERGLVDSQRCGRLAAVAGMRSQGLKNGGRFCPRQRTAGQLWAASIGG